MSDILNPEVDLALIDPAALSRRFMELTAKQVKANSGDGEEISPDECREAIAITRILRRTNTGPAKVKRTKKEKAKVDIEALLKM